MTVSYRDVKADVVSRLMAREWGPGDLLPNEAQLAARYDCARTTVNRALRELADEGYLERKRKSGTRVRAHPARQARFAIPLVRREIEGRGAAYGYSLVERTSEPAPDWLTAQLDLDAGTPVLHLVCLHQADGSPFQHEDRWINLAALPEAAEADFTHTGPNEWLVATVPFTDVAIGFSAIAAGAELAQSLGCAAGAPLFQIDRATWHGGQAVTFVRLSFAPGYRMTTRY